ncbi:MAG: hypothetical protein HOW73_46770 [Polyangiaceae bacterium]|nr:hypothetical protein [Polyangiaceae bacterium]
MKRAATVLAVVAATSSCGNSGGALTQAAVAVAVNVPAAIVNREITGDCYGACSYGTQCNRETGYCDPIDERPAPPPRARELTLSERCAEALRDRTELSNELGPNHPTMVSLARVLKTCETLRENPTATTERCGGYELDVVMLEGDGLGPNHPDIIAARTRLDDCVKVATASFAP